MDDQGTEVLVQVVVEDEGEISWANLSERLENRLSDIRRAIASGAQAVATSLPTLASAEGWALNEVSAAFGVTLTAEAGALLSKASAGATFEVTVTYRRAEKEAPGLQ